MKKILYIAESFGGGVFSFLVNLINNIDDEFEIVIAYGIREETLPNFKEYFSKDIKFIKIENFSRNINLIKDLKALIELKRIIKNEKPDIIHLHSSKAGFLGRFAINCRKEKVFYNPHGFSFLMKDTSILKRILYWIIEKISAFKKCTLISCSKGEYQEALKLSKNVICINNAIDIRKIENKIKDFECKEINFNNLKICTVGRIEFPKNPKFFNKIAETFPNLEFLWIGDGSLKNELTSPNIKVTGWKNNEEVLKILNENDIFLLTSLWEGLPISLLEAMYLKKVCIVSNCIGNRDVIEDGINGFIIKDNNYKEIIKNMNAELYNEISIKANKDVIDKYSIENMIKEYKKGLWKWSLK